MLDPGATEFLKIYGLYLESGGLLGDIVDQGLVTAISQLRTRQPVVFWSNVALGFVLIGYLSAATIGGFRLARTRQISSEWIILWVVALYLALIAGGPIALNRFRLPIMPVISLFIGVGVVSLLDQVRQRLAPTENARSAAE